MSYICALQIKPIRMKRIKLIVFASLLHDQTSVMDSRADLFASIRRFADLEITYPSMLQKDKEEEHNSVSVCFIATGGTEEIFKSFIHLLPRPIYLLSDGFHNSLAASFEISTYLKNRGIESTMLNVPIDNSPLFYRKMEELLFADKPSAQKDSKESTDHEDVTQPINSLPKSVLHYFAKSKIGLIGNASPWLISSSVDTDWIEQKYGCKFIKIDTNELEDTFHNINDNDPIAANATSRSERYLMQGRTKEDLKQAAKMYAALKLICTKYELTALTIKCFSILSPCFTTACLALSLLNDEGIVSACEGDIQSLWSMMYVKGLTSKVSFMANPASTNRDELTVDFAHCTVPLTFVHGYRLTTHFESSIGIGISGSVPCGRYNIVKISGKKLDKIYLAQGSIIMNTNVPQRCRTQIRFKFNKEADFDAFMQKSSGNHVIIYNND